VRPDGRRFALPLGTARAKVPASRQGRGGSGLGAELGKGKLRDARIKDGLRILDCGLPILD
jgi:hypothetical protein